MTNLTNGSTTSKIIRIQDDEKELLFQLREIYANDYRKYSEHIRRESNIPISIKKIYKLLDERKAYRRISDYFHRERKQFSTTKKVRRSHSNGHHKSYHRSSTRGISQVPESISTIQIVDDDDMDDEDDNDRRQSDSSTIPNDDDDEPIETNHIEDDDDDDAQQLQPSSSINLKHEQKPKVSLINDRHKQSIITPDTESSISSKPSLLLVRASIEKALRELDRAIITKSDSITGEYGNEPQRSLINKTNFLTNGHSNLDDIVRSLSTVVSQQQENSRLIIHESSALLADDKHRSEKLSTQQSIKHVLERLNALVDRGHTIYDRVESILSEF